MRTSGLSVFDGFSVFLRRDRIGSAFGAHFGMEGTK